LKVNENLDLSALLERRKAFKAFLERRLPDPAVAEDILQQGLAKAAASGEGPRDSERLLAWFYQVLRNAVIDFYRARAAEARKHEAFLREVEAGTWPGADEESENTICRCFEELLPGLKPEYGELIRRVDLGGESPGAVASEKGETANNVSVRLHRARRALREELALCCGACAAHGCLDCTCAREKTA
jgi:RNA polymerase sigma-70 factor (ECF subfamily)